MADISISLDETLELDTIIKESSIAQNPINNITYSGSNSKDYNMKGIETHTSVFDPQQSGTYTIDINGQELSVEVTDPSTIPDSTGGQVSTITVGVEEYRLHAFTNVGTDTFTIQGDARADVLVVGGGGGGGETDGGGGGAGEIRFQPDYSISAGNTSVSVGKGGAGAPQGGDAEKGGDSSFGSLVALGGGRGESNNKNQDLDGGSGGGGQGTTSSSYRGEAIGNGYGNDGGYGSGDEGGGGGGAGERGEHESEGGYGGDGMYRVTIDSTTYNFNDMFGDYGEIIGGESWFAGGGAGGGEDGDYYGGNGGGADSIGTDNTPDSAMSNTGGGGGGSDDNDGGDGGSGIVLIRLGPL